VIMGAGSGVGVGVGLGAGWVGVSVGATGIGVSGGPLQPARASSARQATSELKRRGRCLSTDLLIVDGL
jgi:hypothetical protein